MDSRSGTDLGHVGSDGSGRGGGGIPPGHVIPPTVEVIAAAGEDATLPPGPDEPMAPTLGASNPEPPRRTLVSPSPKDLAPTPDGMRSASAVRAQSKGPSENGIETRDLVRRYSRTRLTLIASAATSAVFLSGAGTVALNIALPTIQKELHMADTDLQWISSAYSLTNGCFLLLAGRMADIHGRKLVFLVGTGWYTLWTLVGGWMKNGAALVVTRALAGSGASMSIPAGVGIIAANFEGRSRATAFATFAAGAPIGACLGMVLGGLLTEYSAQSWRTCLWVIAAVAFAIFLLALFAFPPDIINTGDRRLDWVGAIFITVGLILLQFVISDGQGAPNGWKTPYIIALLVISVLLIITFFFWERHVINHTSRPPLMRLKLWTRANGRLAAVYMIGCVSWMGFTSLGYHATLFYQQAQGLSPIQALLRFLPMPVSGVACNVLVAVVIARVPTQWLVCLGILATALASVLFAIAPVDGIYWKEPFNGMWMCVLGADFLMATGQLFVSRLALPEEQSLAGALFQTLVQLGGAFGLALTTVIADVYQNKSLAKGKPPIDALVDGLHASFWLGAGLSFAALGIAVVALRGMGTIGKSDKKKVEAQAQAQADARGRLQPLQQAETKMEMGRMDDSEEEEGKDLVGVDEPVSGLGGERTARDRRGEV